jgi:hypothetical protein
MKKASRSLAGAVLLSWTAIAGGCSSPTPHPTAAPGPFQVVVETAREGGASSSQLELLLAADAAGEVTFEQLRAAVDATFACLDSAGIQHSENVTQGPLPQLTYSFASADGSSAVADSCINSHSMYVEWAYQTQPSAQELVDAAFDKKRDEIVACLRQMGIEIDDDASVDEIKRAASITAEEYESRWKHEARMPMDCVSDAGIMNW